ncbi:cation:proton antiporter regulatory subunit [Halosimplex sp. TS25]|uniref:cation:proton antiporter regulatory subunit n=1 Tax=Halosimplex rarum TaxID=3396619 RepID=UPI0039EAFD62
MIPAVPLQLVTDWTTNALLQIIGYGLYASVTALGVSFVYRGYTTRAVPVGVASIIGLSFVALSLNITALTEPAIIGDTGKLHYATSTYLLGVFIFAAVNAEIGRRIGDHFACDVFDIDRLDATGAVARLFRSANLLVTVELPETVEDLDGYPAVDEATKRELAGRQMQFPRRLSDDELASRLVTRLERDFGVGHAHVQLADDGGVASLAVGERPSGIGPSLPPGTVALAVEGDPSPDVSTGDPVEVWATGGDAERLVATGKFRATVGDVATLTVGTSAAEAFDVDETYRLVTRPDTASDLNELVATIWEADETVTAVTVADAGPLHGEFVDWLPVSVLAVERDGEPIPFPAANETLEVGDTVYVLGTPEGLHSLAEYEPQRDSVAAPDAGDDGEESGDGLLAKITGD